MANKLVYDNPQYLAKERFTWLEVQVIDMNHNVILLMKTLTNKLKLFGERGDSSIEVKSKVKLGDHEEPKKESMKPKKEQLSSSIVNHSQSLLKMEAKVGIKLYQSEIN